MNTNDKPTDTHLKLVTEETKQDTDNVTILDVESSLDIPVKRIIDGLPDDLSDIIVIGFDKESRFYFSSNKAKAADILWMLEGAKQELLNITWNDTEE